MRNQAFVALLREIEQLHEAKNHDYSQDGDPLSNLRRCEAFGVPAWKGVLVRLSDKWSRLEQLAGGKLPKNESIRDSLIDNAVYSLLAVLLLDETEKAPTQNLAVENTDCLDLLQSLAAAMPETITRPLSPIPPSIPIFDSDPGDECPCVEIKHGEGFGYTRKAEHKMGCR